MQTVKEWQTSYGRYEAAAMVQGDSLEDLWQILTCQIGPICGVVGAFPCLIPDEWSLENPPEHVREFVGMGICNEGTGTELGPLLTPGTGAEQ